MASILQLLAQKTGKSVDELMETLGKKAASTADDIPESTVMANLQKEAADASVPMGSGANLEALQQASGDIANTAKTAELQQGALNAPFVDAERNVNAGNLGLSYDDAPAAQYGVPAPQSKAPQMSQAAPASLADTASSLQGSVNISRMDPRLKGIAAALGLGGLGAAMMGGDEQPPIPMAPQAKQVAPEQPEVISPVERAASSAALAPKAEGGLDFKALEQTFDKGMAGLPQEAAAPVAPQGPDFVKMLEAAQLESKQARNEAAMLRASELLGAGLARITPEHSSSDILRQNADQATTDAKSLIGGHKEQQSFDASQDDLNDESKLRDPNSEISQTTKAQLAKYGINVKTAMEAKQLNPQIFNLLMADRAQASAREVAKLSATAKGLKQEKDLDEKQRKFARDLRKEATTGALGKQYSTYSTGERMSNAITQFAKNPSGYTDYASLMGGLKTLQGDESVVREAEIRLGMAAGSLKDRITTAFTSKTSGQSLTESQREELIKTVKILTEEAKKQYLQSVAPILEQAQMEGIEPNIILSGSLAGANSAKPQGLTTAPKDGAKTVAKKQYSPSRNQTKIIFSDGTEEIVDGKQ